MVSMPGVAQNTAYLASAFIIQKILAFFYFVVLARLLGPEGIGQYVFAISLATIFSVFLDFGFRQVLVRAVAQSEQHARSLLKRIWVWLLCSGLVVGGGLIIWVQPWSGEVKSLAILLAIITMLIDGITLTIWSVFRGRQNLWYEARSFIIQYAVVVSGGVFFAWLGLSVAWVVGAVLLGSIVHLLLAVLVVLRTPQLLPVGETNISWRQAFTSALPFALAAIFSRGYGYLDIIFVKYFLNEQAVGWYSGGSKIYNAWQFVPGALGASLYPAMSAVANDAARLKKLFEQSVWYLCLLVIPIMVWFWILAEPFVNLLYGQHFGPTVSVLRILSLVFLFSWLGFVYNALLNAKHRQAIATTNMGIALLVSVGANLLLLPRISIHGAAWAMVMSQTTLFILGTIWAKRLGMGLSLDTWQKLGKVLVAGIVQGLLAWWWRDQLFISLVVSGLGFVAVLLLWKVTTPEEWVMLKKLPNQVWRRE